MGLPLTTAMSAAQPTRIPQYFVMPSACVAFVVATRMTSMPLARNVPKNRAGSPMPANASTRLPRSCATCVSSGFRCADNTGLPCAAISPGNPA